MGGHIYGTHFYRKYAPPQKFSPKNWQIYVIFLHLKCHFFCDVNKLPNLHDYAKTSPKNSVRKHRENFFHKYAPFFIQGGGHIYGNNYTQKNLDNICTGVSSWLQIRWSALMTRPSHPVIVSSLPPVVTRTSLSFMSDQICKKRMLIITRQRKVSNNCQYKY